MDVQSVPTSLRLPVLENLKIEDGTISSTESFDEAEDIASSASYSPPSQEILEKLITQIEYYFSDENIVNDHFLLKHMLSNRSHYVSLELIGTFKKIKKLTNDWRDLRYAIKQKIQIVKRYQDSAINCENAGCPPELIVTLNRKGTKVKRVKPLPPLHDDTALERTLVVFNYQSIMKANLLPENCLVDYFMSGVKMDDNETDEINITHVYFTIPGQKFPPNLNYLLTHPSRNKFCAELFSKPCAIVELSKVEGAEILAHQFNGKDNWRGIQVERLMKIDKPKANKEFENNRSRSKPRDIMANRKAYETPPPTSIKSDSDLTNSPRNLTPFSPVKQVPPEYGHAQVAKSYSDFCYTNGSSLNQSGSPWLMRNRIIRSDDKCQNARERNLIRVIRQPKGPDGTKGFCSGL